MDRDTVKKGNELVEEIDELKKYKKVMEINGNNGKETSHFEFRPHYGDSVDSQILQIEPKHNHRFIAVIDTIINELEQELIDL